MYVCLCNAVREADIHAAVEDGVRSMRQLAKRTGCSTQCGRCATAAAGVLDDALSERRGFLPIIGAPQAA